MTGQIALLSIDVGSNGSNGAADLLHAYLPDTLTRTSGERLQAIAGKALTDGAPRIERRLHTSLLPEERNDARATLVYVGLRCALLYDPSMDKGTGHIPVEIRFGRFAYLRMRLALIDWERKTFGDRRPGRTRHPEIRELVDYNDELDADDGLLFEDMHANQAQVDAWVRTSALEGKNLSTWVLETLDRRVRWVNATARSDRRRRDTKTA